MDPRTAVGVRTPLRMPARHFDRLTWGHETGWFAALGHEFRVRTTDPVLGAYLDDLFGTYEHRTHGDPARTYSIIERSPRAKRRYALYFGTERIAWNSNADLVLGYLLWHINRQVVERSDEYLLLHAGAVERDGAAVLLPASMESGKTTTVAGLLRDHGFRYLTDEAAAIDAETLVIHPFPKSLSVDPGSWEVLADLQPTVPEPVEPFCQSQWHVDPRRVGDGRLGQPSRPVLVVSPAYTEGATSELVPVRGGAAVLMLAENAFNLMHHGGRGLEVLADVVRGAPCYRLIVGDLESAGALVSRELDRVLASSGVGV